MQSWRDLAVVFGNHKGLRVTAVVVPKTQSSDWAHVLFRNGKALPEDDPIRLMLDEPSAAAARLKDLAKPEIPAAEAADRWISHALEHPAVSGRPSLHRRRIFEISDTSASCTTKLASNRRR